MKKININIIILRRWRRVISKMGQIKKKNELKVVIYGEQDWEWEWVWQKIVVFCYKPFTVFDFLKTMHPVNSLEKNNQAEGKNWLRAWSNPKFFCTETPQSH